MKNNFTLLLALAGLVVFNQLKATPLSVSVSHTSVSCDGGSNGTATATASGGTSPYTYSWSNGRTTQNISSLTAGNYTIIVRDFASNTATAAVAITEPNMVLGVIASSPRILCYGA